jgi:hypothetical protein
MDDRSPLKQWLITHVFRTCTALVTLVAFGLAFLYRPVWLTRWLRTTMTGLKKVGLVDEVRAMSSEGVCE